MPATTTRDYATEYRAAVRAGLTADTDSDRSLAGREQELILDAAHTVGANVPVSQIHAEEEPQLTRRNVYVGLNGVGIPVYETRWV